MGASSYFACMQNDRIRWWPIYHDDQECVGKIQLFIGSTIISDETNNIKVSFTKFDYAKQNPVAMLHFF